MPFGNGTGPVGLGPMTGRAAGYCAGYPVPGYMNPAPVYRSGVNPISGRGFYPYGYGYPGAGSYGTPYMPYGPPGFGFGRGRGFGRGFWRGRGGGRGRGRWFYGW